MNAHATILTRRLALKSGHQSLNLSSVSLRSKKKVTREEVNVSGRFDAQHTVLDGQQDGSNCDAYTPARRNFLILGLERLDDFLERVVAQDLPDHSNAWRVMLAVELCELDFACFVLPALRYTQHKSPAGKENERVRGMCQCADSQAGGERRAAGHRWRALELNLERRHDALERIVG